MHTGKMKPRMEYTEREIKLGSEKECVQVVWGARCVEDLMVEVMAQRSLWAGDRWEQMERVLEETWYKENKSLART